LKEEAIDCPLCGELDLEEDMDLSSEYGMNQQQGISQPDLFRFHGYWSVHLFLGRPTFGQQTKRRSTKEKMDRPISMKAEQA